jgi:hypothetical protein
MSLAAVARFDKLTDGHLFTQRLEDAHIGAFPPYEARRFG